MVRVLVTDGRSRAALAVVRSLGKKGIDVTAGEAFRCSSFYSKYTKKKWLYPPPDKNPKLFLEEMFNIVKKDGYDVVIPVRDDVTSLLSKHIEKFSKYTRIPTPEHNVYLKGRDKAQTLKIAKKNNIPHPKTFFIENEKDLDVDKIIHDFKFPILIKPRKSSGSRGVAYVDSPEKFMNEFKNVKRRFGLPIIQEFIPQGGGAYGVSMLFNRGKPRAIFTHKRLREYPITGGPSTLRESVRHPEMENYATKLLKALNWHGVAMVEFRVDPRDKKPKLMEVNPRFWGSLSLAIHAGVDFPYLLYKMAMEGDVEPVFEYKLGVKTRWLLLGDILWFMNTPNKWKVLPEFLRFKEKNLNYDIISLSDPYPAIGAILEGFKSIMLKERREHAFERGW